MPCIGLSIQMYAPRGKRKRCKGPARPFHSPSAAIWGQLLAPAVLASDAAERNAALETGPGLGLPVAEHCAPSTVLRAQ
jgi:hypothetical protein